MAAQLEGLGQAFREPTRHFAHVETGEAEALVARARVEISAAETHEPAPEHDVTEFVEEGGLEPGDEPGSHHHHVGEEGCEHCPECERCEDCPHCDHDEEAPVLALSLRSGSTILELNRELRLIRRLCTPIFRDPPDRAQYLLLFHNLAGDAMMCINGRKFLGNTPTIVSGENTKKRFGVVGMGNVDGFHTFHLHGHRWVIPGPEGNNPGAIQGSPQIVAVSQFEDTRTFGPANSFSFTINPGSFMRAEPGLGEWHMHCHVLTHMMDGMMGSLLVVTGGALAPPAAALQVGVPCPAMGMGAQPPGPTVVNIDIESLSFNPSTISVAAGSTVRWTNRNGPHTVTSTSVPAAAPPFDSSPLYPMNGISAAMQLNDVFQQVLTMAGTYNYFCKVHGTAMSGTVTVS